MLHVFCQDEREMGKQSFQMCYSFIAMINLVHSRENVCPVIGVLKWQCGQLLESTSSL